jgi:alkaline phosphatase
MPRHRLLYLFIISALVFILLGGCSATPAGEKKAAPQIVKNVIVLMPDGCSSEQYTLARWFKGEPLALDQIRVSAVKTYIADSVVADQCGAQKSHSVLRAPT